MKKKILAMLLAVVMAAGLLPGTAFAAGATLIQSAKITLSQQYLYAGANGEWYTEEAYRAAPVVTDLDGDGRLEVLNAAYTLSVMDAATGALKWRVNAGKDRSTAYDTLGNVTPGQVFCDFKVLDIDRDGKKEIVIGYGNGTISVLDSKGYFKAGWPQKPTDGSIRSIAVDDLDLDGKMEIIVGVAHEDPVSVWVYHCDGTLASGWPQLDASQNGTRNPNTDEYRFKTAYSAGLYGNGITTGDLDGDGYPEIIVPTDTQYIDAYHYDGSLVKASDLYGGRMWGKIALYEDYGEEIACKNEGWGWNSELDSRATTYRAQMTNSGTAYTDLDGDGTCELVVTAYIEDRTTYTTQGNNTATIADTRYMTAFILNGDRTRYKNEKLGFDWTSAPNELNSEIGTHLRKKDAGSKNGEVYPVPVCSDLDGDGYQEILFNSYDGKLHCFSLDKSEWSFTLPKTTSTVYEYATAPVCVDLDKDGTQEVIFASWTDCEDENRLTGTYAGAGHGGTGVNGALYVLDCNGKLLASMDLHNGYTTWEDRNNPSAGFTNGVMATPTVADIDGDGKYEVLLNTTYYALCAYKITVNSAGVSAYGGFTDVKASDWYGKEVLWAVDKGITSGTGGTTFTPGRVCSHGEIITFLWRAAGKLSSTVQAPVETEPYDDFRAAANWAYEKGIIDESFRTSAECTRADTVAYMWKAAGSPGDAPASSFPDVSADYAAAVNWAVSKGVTKGAGDGSVFSPNDTCTRGQIATFLYRAYA